ncbi:permease-like cell division protein FtsX [Candidatus Parcubacteria bacterium]|nr:permease-like cell division protein FtsX [Candidatus Parcubacteria bacterium]
MPIIISLKRIFNAGWKGFYKNIGLSIATVFILVLAVSLATSLFIIKDITKLVIADFQEKVDISVYFKEDCLEEDIFVIKEELEAFSEVKKVEYVSKEQALEAFKQRHQDDEVLMGSLEELGRNPFFASLNITSWQPSQYEEVDNFLKNAEFNEKIAKIDYFQKKPIIEKIFSISYQINTTGIILALIVSIIAILIVFNHIKLAILNYHKEVEVQRLVGAANWFIRGPFVIQSILAGIFAAIICLLFFTVSIFFLSPQIGEIVSGFNLFEYFVSNLFIIFLIQLLTGIGLGVISSLIAIRKYLKV